MADEPQDDSTRELEDGWRATTPDDDTVLRRMALALGERGTWSAERLGGRVVRRPDALLGDFGSEVLFDNNVILTVSPDRADLDGVIADARSLYADRPWMLVSALPTPDLRDRGLQLMGHPPLMVRPPGGDPPSPPDGLRVIEVTDAERFVQWNLTLAEAFPTPNGQPSLFDERVLGGPVHFWLGLEGDRPVATAAAFVRHGVVEVDYISTMPDARRRGYGAAVTWAATLADPSRPAALIASDDGRPMYEQMGYLPLTRFTIWYEGQSWDD